MAYTCSTLQFFSRAFDFSSMCVCSVSSLMIDLCWKCLTTLWHATITVIRCPWLMLLIRPVSNTYAILFMCFFNMFALVTRYRFFLHFRYQFERIDGRIHGPLRQEAIDRFTAGKVPFAIHSLSVVVMNSRHPSVVRARVCVCARLSIRALWFWNVRVCVCSHTRTRYNTFSFPNVISVVGCRPNTFCDH